MLKFRQFLILSEEASITVPIAKEIEDLKNQLKTAVSNNDTSKAYDLNQQIAAKQSELVNARITEKSSQTISGESTAPSPKTETGSLSKVPMGDLATPPSTLTTAAPSELSSLSPTTGVKAPTTPVPPITPPSSIDSAFNAIRKRNTGYSMSGPESGIGNFVTTYRQNLGTDVLGRYGKSFYRL